MLIYGGGGGGGRRLPRPRIPVRLRRPERGPAQQTPPPGAPPPGAPTPAAGPPQGSQIPGQGLYLQKQALAEQAYQTALAQLAQRKSQTFRDYGFLESGGVDPNAQHGAIQNLWRGQAANAEQEDYSLLGRGIQGGLAGQSYMQRKIAEGGQNLELQNNFTNNMQELANMRTQAEATKNEALLAAQQEALTAAQENEQFTPAEAETEAPAPGPLPGRRRARRHLARAAAQGQQVRQRRNRGRRR